MRKNSLLLFGLFFTIIAAAQKKLPNPLIGKNEIEITGFNFQDNAISYAKNAWGIQTIYRWTWEKSNKVGIGGLIGADYNDYDMLNDNVHAYGAIFADLIQFIGKRQKWSIEGQIGHGIYKKIFEFDDATATGYSKQTAGMYYSISAGYRLVVTKKMLIVISPVYFFRNYRHNILVEYKSPPSIERMESVDKRRGWGIKVGVVF